jgi:hypothetical protein
LRTFENEVLATKLACLTTVDMQKLQEEISAVSLSLRVAVCDPESANVPFDDPTAVSLL